MHLKLFVLVFLVSLVSAIFLGGGGSGGGGGGIRIGGGSSSEEGRGGRGRGRGRGRPIHFHSHSSSHSHSDSHEGHGHGRGRTRRPPPPREKCEEGTMEFDRPTGKFCFKLVFAKVNHAGAIATCSGMGYVMSGFQNANERMKVADEALKMIQGIGQVIAGMWIGGYRVGRTFEWTDGMTTGMEGWKWGLGQPDWDRPDKQWCLQQFIVAPAYWANPSWTAFQHGDLDDYWCERNSDPPTRLVACGKRATPVSG